MFTLAGTRRSSRWNVIEPVPLRKRTWSRAYLRIYCWDPIDALRSFRKNRVVSWNKRRSCTRLAQSRSFLMRCPGFGRVNFQYAYFLSSNHVDIGFSTNLGWFGIVYEALYTAQAIESLKNKKNEIFQNWRFLRFKCAYGNFKRFATRASIQHCDFEETWAL